MRASLTVAWKNARSKALDTAGESLVKPAAVKIARIYGIKYVLSTMGVSKESISKFLIGNRFHVKFSPENCKQSLRVKS